MDFFSLGGYDERMIHGWGHEDTDLAKRAQAGGLERVLCPKFGKAILHGDRERIKNYRSKDKSTSRRLHKAISQRGLRKGELIANQKTAWGAGNVLVNFSTMVSL
jgi:predicted glycosyltransferase involved in capsule biosynthesis